MPIIPIAPQVEYAILSSTYFNANESSIKATITSNIALIQKILCLKPSDFFNNKFAIISINAEIVIMTK